MQPRFEHRQAFAVDLLKAMVGEIYRQLVFARPRAAEAAMVAAFAAHHGTRARVAALLEGVGHWPQLEATGRLLELFLPFPAGVRA